MSNNNSIECQFRQTTHIVRTKTGHIKASLQIPEDAKVLANLPPLYPEWMGDRAFLETHGVRFPYVGGEMANGITTTRMVKAFAHAGMLCFFGAAGLTYEKVAAAIAELKTTLGPQKLSWGSNLIHSPNEPELEARVAELYIQQGVTKVSASAYMQLTLHIVRYACTGLHQNKSGQIQRRHHVFAKISRPETAIQFMSPAPETMLNKLYQQGLLTQQEVMLAKQIPLSEDITVEADSGGHTDRQALSAIFPTIALVRDELCKQHQYLRNIRLGAAGGLGTPNAVAAAFSMGAAYVLTGTVNQACVESGLHEVGRKQLALAKTGDVTMTPASDMFEQGVKLQVLKKGTMYPNRAAKLYDLYVRYNAIEDIPLPIIRQLENDIFKNSIEKVWQNTQTFWQKRDPTQIKKSASDAKHKMALIFRAYLGLSSRWAIDGDPSRIMDYQIWCGPAIAAFNQWTKDSFLAAPENRTVFQVALNLLEGAAVVMRANQFRVYGVDVSSDAFNFTPRKIQTEINYQTA